MKCANESSNSQSVMKFSMNNFFIATEKFRGTLNRPPYHFAAEVGKAPLTPEEEDKVVEALEELRINYNMRQWRVCSLICESLSDKFRTIANQEQK